MTYRKATPMTLTTIRYVLVVLLAGVFSCSSPPVNLYAPQVLEINSQLAKEIAENLREAAAVEVADGLDLSLWATDTLIKDPVAISIDEKGRLFYVQANRLEHSEFDIRGHRDWMTQSISFQSVEDRRAFLRKTFETHNEAAEKFLEDLNQDSTKDWRDLTVEKEEVWFLEDKSGNGVADRAQRYLVDFHEEITDLANGIEVHDGEVFIPVGPDMWRTGDDDMDGIADRKESISHGFGVHIGFGAHGMSGAKMGPDGRIWWGIGDIGMNVVDKEGKNWKYPNRGVIARCEPDGSNFEVFAMGVRNTHEFTFDKYGNLITEDNDGDHRGERERLVYLINGSDTGWRINWQFGKYTDPDNNDYKVWMDEQMHTPRWDGQAAYFLPCIQNYVNGPTGLVYNPGTALSEEWKDHFFVAEFRGTPANSPLHAFTLKPDGAGFALKETKEIAKGLLPTGIDFGPDGALYFSDWIMGWNINQEGRLWKLDVPGEENSAARVETKRLLGSDFTETPIDQLTTYLSNEDMRVRQKAQFELVKRGKKGLTALNEVAKSSADQLARVHAIWGIGQFARKKGENATSLVALLSDKDDEIKAQAAKIIGDVRYWGASDELLGLLKHPSPRVKMFAVEALGRTKDQIATMPIIEVMIQNADKDLWLRHAGMIALGRIGNTDALTSLCSHPNRSARIAAVVALRRMEDPGVACFLQDEEEFIVAEAARAINDDFSIEEALPQLAETLKDERFTNEALIRRAINANLRVGGEDNLKLLAEYASRQEAPAEMRAEAIAALSTWEKPSVLDRVDGRYRGEVVREGIDMNAMLAPKIGLWLADTNGEVQTAAAKAAGKLNVQDADDALLALMRINTDGSAQQAALSSLNSMKSELLSEALELGMASSYSQVKSTALEILPESGIAEETAVPLFQDVLRRGTTDNKQAAFAALGSMTGPESQKVLDIYLGNLRKGRVAPEIQLDLIEAVEKQNNPQLMEKLQAYQDSKDTSNPIAAYSETLYGGNPERGGRVFYTHEGAQCVRCHSIFELGGNAGPGLMGVGARLSREKLLESMIAPSAAYAAGYEVVNLKLKDGTSVAGYLQTENSQSLSIKVGEEITQVAKTDIESRTSIPSSMPPMGKILTKRELRDLVAALASLQPES